MDKYLRFGKILKTLTLSLGSGIDRFRLRLINKHYDYRYANKASIEQILEINEHFTKPNLVYELNKLVNQRCEDSKCKNVKWFKKKGKNLPIKCLHQCDLKDYCNFVKKYNNRAERLAIF